MAVMVMSSLAIGIPPSSAERSMTPYDTVIATRMSQVIATRRLDERFIGYLTT
jgi:hypothetical protein